MEDRRASGGGGGMGMLALLPLFARFGLPGILVFVALMYFGGGGNLFGGSAEPLHTQGEPRGAVTSESDPEAPLVQFVSFVLDDVQRTWTDAFARDSRRYEPAVLVLFRDRTTSGCGMGAAAMGPFYCSRDRRVYIDLSFYRDLRKRFGAPGDFAQAYVIAHEIGHHVQNLKGTSERVHSAATEEQGGASGLSVRLELQADCYAGVWAHATRERAILESGDLEEALTAAAAIGDDRLQTQARGTITPETWTHGSSEQRVRWFRRGLETGNVEACDTFGSARL